MSVSPLCVWAYILVITRQLSAVTVCQRCVQPLLTLLPTLAFLPNDWQRGLMAMLEKKAGLILALKLHVILLMEADFNFANKEIFGQCMTWLAEDRDLIPG